MDVIFSSVLHFCTLYLVQCSLGLVAPESVGTCGLELSIWTQLALHLLVALVVLPLARAALTTHRAPPPLRRRTAVLERPRPARPTRSRPDLFGMERYEARLIDFLERDRDDDDDDDQDGGSSTTSSSSSMLAIIGARGVGKSTLLRLARTYYDQQRFFQYVFYADATADALRRELARGVGVWWPAGEDHIATYLRNNSFLLLLDNVPAGGVGPPACRSRSDPGRRVFATRDEPVCAVAMGYTDVDDNEGNVIRMGCLGDEDAWNLFRYCVGCDVIESNPLIMERAKEIVGKCGGNPGALVRVGLALSTYKGLHAWIYRAEELLSNKSSPGRCGSGRN